MATGYQPGAGIRVSFACLRRDQSTAIIHFRQAAGTVLRAVDGTECRDDADTALGAVVWGLVARVISVRCLAAASAKPKGSRQLGWSARTIEVRHRPTQDRWNEPSGNTGKTVRK